MELLSGENMKKLLFILALLGIMVLLLPAVSADTVGASRAVTLNGPSGMLVPLGIENVMPLAAARVWYNWICVIILLPLAAVASQRNHHQYAIIIPAVAAILMGFGWLYTVNMAQTLGAIIFVGFIGAAYYIKTVLRINWGMGGPGSTLMNLVVFMIIISATFGIINSSGIWPDNTGVQPNQFTNVNLEDEIQQMGNTGGGLDDLVNLGTFFLTSAAASLKVFITMCLSIGAFGAAVLLMYPWLAQSALVLAIISLLQTVIWILYAKFIYDIFYVKSQFATEF